MALARFLHRSSLYLSHLLPLRLNDQRKPNLILGLYGFDVQGPTSFPSLRMHYWSSILGILRKTVGAEVIVTTVPGTGSIASLADQLPSSILDWVGDGLKRKKSKIQPQ